MTSDSSDNRRSFRVSERVYLKYEVIDDLDFNRGLEHRKLRLGGSNGVRSKIVDLDARLDERMFLLRSESGRLAECMSLLNDKINAIIEHLPELRQSKASLAQSDPQTCDIGADGMAFAVDQQLAPGTKLALRFLLEADNRYVETFAEVLRNIDPPGDPHPDRPYGVAVAFSGMKTSEKEMIIQHLFNRESETLRMRRLKIDAAEAG